MINFPRYVNPGEAVTAKHINSVIDAIRKVQPVAGANVTIDQGLFGTRINAQPKGVSGGSSTVISSKVRPFDCRWMDKGDNKGEWQIYLPRGCAVVIQGNVNKAYIPVNDDATDGDGAAIYAWYKIPTPKDTTATVTTTTGFVAKEWTVYVQMKPWERMKATTDNEDYAPIQWSASVATLIEVKYADHQEGGKTVEGGYSRSTVRTLEDAYIEHTWDVSGSYSVEYKMKSTSKDAAVEAKLTNIVSPIGRLQAQNEEPTDITGWNKVWIVINHPGESFEITVMRNVTASAAKSNDDKTVFRVYEMNENVVKSDLRKDIPTMNFYTNAPDT